MKLRRSAASMAATIVIVIVLAGIALVWLYLTQYGMGRLWVSLITLVVGLAVASIVYATIVQVCKRGECAVMILLLLIGAVAAVVLSTVMTGRITYARWGLTVYGLLPVPVFDITISPAGFLWLRDKVDYLTLEEVESHLTSRTEVLVVGTGWENRMGVDPRIRRLYEVEVYIQTTPNAIKAYREHRSQGRKVVLILNTTS